MIGIIITLSVFCIILLLILGNQDDKNASLAAENGLLKGRLENIRDNMMENSDTSAAPLAKLTMSDIIDAIRYVGYVPEIRDYSVMFMAGEDPIIVEADRLPLFFVSRYYTVQTTEWDVSILKKAAHLMSDDVVMVKAFIDERPERTTIRFYVSAMDRNYHSFRESLINYIAILADANRRILELYEQLQAEHTHSEISTIALQPTNFS